MTRLTAVGYADRSAATWNNAGASDEKDISYDQDGNIHTLTRNAKIAFNGAAFQERTQGVLISVSIGIAIILKMLMECSSYIKN